jgi:hypothetical protein
LTTYFARHTENIRIDDATRLLLWNERRIAIHYPDYADGVPRPEDNSSLIEKDYPSRGRRPIRALNALAAEGGYVCAEHYGQAAIQVGWVPPGSSIQLVVGKWGGASEFPGKRAILKTLPLTKTRVLTPLESVVVLAGRPRMGTLQQWHGCKARIIHLVEGIQKALALDDLLPYEQETLCSEFLRMPEAELMDLPRMQNLLMPVGRTLKDVDIVGLATNGNMVVCQVTFSKRIEAAEKVVALKKYAGPNRPLFFCNESENSIFEGVQIVSMRRVFDMFTATEFGANWLATLRHTL